MYILFVNYSQYYSVNKKTAKTTFPHFYNEKVQKREINVEMKMDGKLHVPVRISPKIIKTSVVTILGGIDA
jgi:hypothetical protein